MDPMSEDGEYWISPPPFNRNEVKIYCHDMANNPREYITLKAFNRGSYPMISFEGCERLRSDRSELEGSYVFSKLRVNVEVKLPVQKQTHGGAVETFVVNSRSEM